MLNYQRVAPHSIKNTIGDPQLRTTPSSGGMLPLPELTLQVPQARTTLSARRGAPRTWKPWPAEYPPDAIFTMDCKNIQNIKCIYMYIKYIHTHYITLHYITLHYIALHCFALHCITLHCIALHCIALHCIALHYIALHCIALHCIALHCITHIYIQYTTLHYIALHCITLHYIAFDH